MVQFSSSFERAGPQGGRLFITDSCMGLVESLGEFFPTGKWQRCMVHFYRNGFSVVLGKRMREVAAMLKAIHASEDKEAAQQKAEQVCEKLNGMRLKEAAKKVCDSIGKTLTYYDFPRQHHTRIRTNNALERIMKEIRRRTRMSEPFRMVTRPRCSVRPACAMSLALSGGQDDT